MTGIPSVQRRGGSLLFDSYEMLHVGRKRAPVQQNTEG